LKVEGEALKEHQFTHEKLKSWQLAKIFAKRVYEATTSYPSTERYGLVDQLRRATVSVMSNLAEGSGSTNARDQAHFSQLAYGSLMETDAQLQLSMDLGYLPETVYRELRQAIQELSAAISGLRAAQMKKANT
jgi:four helix bundle protein